MAVPDTAGAVLLVDKPAGKTSHDVVAEVRRERGVKAGHAGTLDPFATGLLLVLLGKATRLQRFLVGLPKTYLATARLGWTSSTGDSDGELTETGGVLFLASPGDSAARSRHVSIPKSFRGSSVERGEPCFGPRHHRGGYGDFPSPCFLQPRRPAIRRL